MCVPITASAVRLSSKKLLQTHLERAKHGKMVGKKKRSKSSTTGWATTGYCHALGSVTWVGWTREQPQPRKQPVFTHLRCHPQLITGQGILLTKLTAIKFLSISGYQENSPFSLSKFQKQKNHNRIFNREHFSTEPQRKALRPFQELYDLLAPTTPPLLTELPSRVHLIREASLITILKNNPSHFHSLLAFFLHL